MLWIDLQIILMIGNMMNLISYFLFAAVLILIVSLIVIKSNRDIIRKERSIREELQRAEIMDHGK